MSDFSNERHPKAKIEHVCDECSNLIKPGETYQYLYVRWDGDKPTAFKTCSECEAIRHEFNMDIDDPDEWALLGQLEYCLQGRKSADLLARFQAHKAKATL